MSLLPSLNTKSENIWRRKEKTVLIVSSCKQNNLKSGITGYIGFWNKGGYEYIYKKKKIILI